MKFWLYKLIENVRAAKKVLRKYNFLKFADENNGKSGEFVDSEESWEYNKIQLRRVLIASVGTTPC